MFIIKPINPSDWEKALFLLSYYHVKTTLRSNGDDTNTTYMVVEEMIMPVEQENHYRLAEMCFQMNWHQHTSKLCPDCIDNSDYFDSCGHLAFSKPIKHAF